MAIPEEISKILSPKHKKLLEQNIQNNENVLTALVGSFEQALIALDERLIIIKPGSFLFGIDKVTSFYYSGISSIEIRTGTFFGHLEIISPGYNSSNASEPQQEPKNLPNCLPFQRFGRERVQLILEQIRQKIKESKTTIHIRQDVESINIVTELEKLIDLHKQGLLTQEEFDMAKKKILGA